MEDATENIGLKLREYYEVMTALCCNAKVLSDASEFWKTPQYLFFFTKWDQIMRP